MEPCLANTQNSVREVYVNHIIVMMQVHDKPNETRNIIGFAVIEALAPFELRGF